MNKAYWEEMVERYFDATTTEAEEQQLKRFLATDAARGTAFDEARAVIGLFATHRSSRQAAPLAEQHAPSPFWQRLRWPAAAAAAAMLAFGLWHLLAPSPSTYYACIDGHVTTDRQAVVRAMHESMQALQADATTDMAAQQLSDLFNSPE